MGGKWDKGGLFMDYLAQGSTATEYMMGVKQLKEIPDGLLANSS